MKYFLFEDIYNGGFFYVKAYSLDECWEIIDGTFYGDAAYMRYTNQYCNSFDEIEPTLDIY